MAGKVAERKAKLRETLITLAEVQIAEAGLSSLRARSLAKDAGCALGAIYNVFEDLDHLVLEVNGRTFRALGVQVAAAVNEAKGADANDRLIAMSLAYLDFADSNAHLWRALFDVKMSVEMQVPSWYLDEMGKLFSYIMRPLAEIFPEKDEHELDLMTRALFSSVHGIVLLGLERRISAVPLSDIKEMIALILGQVKK